MTSVLGNSDCFDSECLSLASVVGGEYKRMVFLNLKVPSVARDVPTIVWTYGHFASRIPVLYVFGHLQKNTSKKRPIFKVEGHGSNSCPKAPKSEKLEAIYGAQLCEDLINQSGTQSKCVLFKLSFLKHRRCRF
jgi:hypothetical protein